MINLNSKYYLELDEALKRAINHQDFSDWERLVKNPMSDGFLNVANSEDAVAILKELNFQGIKELFLNIDRFDSDLTNPLLTIDAKAMIFYHLWFNLKKNINEVLTNTRVTVNIPETGGVLVYIAGLSLCLVVKFDRVSKILKIVDVIENPKSAFDFWESIEKANMTSRNILKELINTGHKLIYHRGLLIHVDRRKDLQVFGPSIDTLLMNEILVQKFFENENKILNAIEVGCGNGLLTVSLAKYSEELRKLETIDINFNAIYCTHKNLVANLTDYLTETRSISKINGRFDPGLLKSKYDLIICNPPYIPIPKSDRKQTSNDVDYYTAVGGLELIDELLNNLDEILAKEGTLFLLISHLSYKYVVDKLKNKFNFSEPLENGHEVLFDVEAVFNNERWFKYLIEEIGIEKRSGVYYHTIHPLLIKHK